MKPRSIPLCAADYPDPGALGDTDPCPLRSCMDGMVVCPRYQHQPNHMTTKSLSNRDQMHQHEPNHMSTRRYRTVTKHRDFHNPQTAPLWYAAPTHIARKGYMARLDTVVTLSSAVQRSRHQRAQRSAR